MIAEIKDVALFDNTEERVPLVLVLDCSGSMEGKPIEALNQGLQELDNDLKSDPIAAKRVRILVIALGGSDEVTVGEWRDVRDFIPPTLNANGTTPTGAAMQQALQEIETQKLELRRAGIPYKRPLLYLMSDGNPTDSDWKTVASACRSAEDSKRLSIFSIAVGDYADTAILGSFSSREALRLQGLKFKELFLWLSASVKAVSVPRSGKTTQVPSTDSWSSVETSIE